MSIDYTDTWVAKGSLTTAPAGAQTDVLGYIWSKTYNFKILHANLLFTGTPANSNTTFKIQKGDATLGSFTDVATYAITASNTIGTTAEVRVADASTDATLGLGYRFAAITVTGANAGLKFEAAVTCTAVGY